MTTSGAVKADGPGREFDYVVVGAGSAGCVLANRLSAGDARVLVLEAGPEARRREIAVPAAFPSMMRTEVDWSFQTTPQVALGGRRVPLPRGRVVGGSSSINAMIHTRGHPTDFEEWGRRAGPGWSPEALEPCFARVEGAAGDSRTDGGGVRVMELPDPNPLTRAFLKAAAAEGFGSTDAPDAFRVDQFGLSRVTQRRGRRYGPRDGYLEPIRHRPNLAIRTGAVALRVLFEGTRATAVEYARDGRTEVAGARRAIVLAAGAFKTPQLLMLSGVGPAQHLREHGIAVVCDRPGVGDDLQDHPLVVSLFRCTRPITLLAAPSLPNLLRFLLLGRGPLTSNVAEAIGFVRSRPETAAPDIELIFAPVQYDVTTAPTLHAFGVGTVLLQPVSRGTVRLASADPQAAPAIDPRLLCEEDDRATLAAGVRLAHRLLRASAFDAVRGEPLVPPAELSTDDEVAAFLRDATETVYHPVGTCRTGTDADAPLDPRLRVRGVAGLRVVDASIMPSIVRGHPNAAALALAENGARLILEDDRGGAAAADGGPGAAPS